MKKPVLALAFFMILAVYAGGCIGRGREFPTAPVSSIRPNMTTKQEIFSAFGEPVEKGIDTGFETWTYYYYTLGQGFGGKRLNIIFNPDGTVRNYAYSAN
ncbi:MAG TPA: hypothetical protein VGB25_02185 [Candidatus Binatia bacterium]